MKGNVPFQPSCWSLLFTQKAFFLCLPYFLFRDLHVFFYLKRTSFRSLFCPVYSNDDMLRNKKFAIFTKPLWLNNNISNWVWSSALNAIFIYHGQYKKKEKGLKPWSKCLWAISKKARDFVDNILFILKIHNESRWSAPLESIWIVWWWMIPEMFRERVSKFYCCLSSHILQKQGTYLCINIS